MIACLGPEPTKQAWKLGDVRASSKIWNCINLWPDDIHGYWVGARGFYCIFETNLQRTRSVFSPNNLKPFPLHISILCTQGQSAWCDLYKEQAETLFLSQSYLYLINICVCICIYLICIWLFIVIFIVFAFEFVFVFAHAYCYHIYSRSCICICTQSKQNLYFHLRQLLLHRPPAAV